ncbi:hypothetical protein [Sulfitobacter sabulilitoris]|uniref:Uncharacterized protein n=1 Tax=Sulfitobacter sabulilitoris TaxID=2562655 RepID=A0A5S3PL92_9RHOB|nr:hypothetical protein [Sulfitobacter sabulilitoris]TMM55204.1 hypothetical protein FDT80_06485 [Sulfitobacter sabulilitoris]
MPIITRWQDIESLGGSAWLTGAEAALLADCQAGRECVLPYLQPMFMGPPAPDQAIRAEVLRYAIAGGCDRCRVQARGVAVRGARVLGDLDLGFLTGHGATVLRKCVFDGPFVATRAQFKTLVVDASRFRSLDLEGATIRGDGMFRKIECTGIATLSGAVIDGEFDCFAARFMRDAGHALNASRITVGDSVTLANLEARACVSFLGAEIGGNLDCRGAQFKARGQDQKAFDAYRVHVAHALLWGDIDPPSAQVDLRSAHVGDLSDDLKSWPSGGGLFLDGFTYQRISAAPTDARSRIDWLGRGCTFEGVFCPQPFTYLATVLREMGHDADARAVLSKREFLLKQAYRRKIMTADGRSGRNYGVWIGADILAFVHWVFADLLLRWVVGYGHHPFRSLIVLVLLIMAATIPAHYAYEEGSFAPNSGPILASADWQDHAGRSGNPAAQWSSPGAPGQDWESFNRYAYAADLVIPIVDLGQTAAWAPSTSRGPWGWHLWWLRWVFVGMGWVVTALGAAAITGIIRRD